MTIILNFKHGNIYTLCGLINDTEKSIIFLRSWILVHVTYW
jgi:hypothetical protein